MARAIGKEKADPPAACRSCKMTARPTRGGDMATEIKLPALGENLNAGDVLEVRVAPGATVSKGQTLLEIEAEKSTIEVPSPLEGRVTQVMVSKGDRVSVGQVLCLIES